MRGRDDQIDQVGRALAPPEPNAADRLAALANDLGLRTGEAVQELSPLRGPLQFGEGAAEEREFERLVARPRRPRAQGLDG